MLIVRNHQFLIIFVIGTRCKASSWVSILDNLLDLWDAEEKSRNKMNSGKPDNNKNDNDDLQMFNDRQWKDQWYMVRSLFYIVPTNLFLTTRYSLFNEA